MKRYFKKEQIEKIERILVVDKTKNNYYTYVPAKYKNYLFYRKQIRPEGFLGYDFSNREEILSETLEYQKRYIIIDNIVYYRAEVIIYFKNSNPSFYFDTYEEAVEFANKFVNENNLSDSLICVSND